VNEAKAAKSRPAWARELKHFFSSFFAPAGGSRPAWARELKHLFAIDLNTGGWVAPRVGA